MAFDYRKLRGRIREVFKTEASFAEQIQMSSTSLSGKLNNKVEFSQSEIDRAVRLLSIPQAEIPLYFFTLRTD